MWGEVLACHARAGLGCGGCVACQPGGDGVAAHLCSCTAGEHERLSRGGPGREFSKDPDGLAVKGRDAVLAALPMADDVWGGAEVNIGEFQRREFGDTHAG